MFVMCVRTKKRKALETSVRLTSPCITKQLHLRRLFDLYGLEHCVTAFVRQARTLEAETLFNHCTTTLLWYRNILCLVRHI